MKKQILILFCTVLFLIMLLQCLPVQDTAIIPAASPEENCVMALTFDDGPSPIYTPPLLEGLKERNIRATFFLLGKQAEEQPALVQAIAAEGHQIGNHTYSHVFLNQMNREDAAEEVRRGELTLESILGRSGYWIRPPYGAADPELLEKLSAPVICWSVDPRDWECRDTDAIVTHILENASDGDIILLHDSYPTSVEAALQTVDRLQARGVEFLTVEQLLTRRGIQISPGRLYRNAQ